MGGSAGGLEAFEQFFSHLPSDTGMAFVLVPHLEPTHKGMMPELLGRHTEMPVVEVKDGMRVRPNRVYVIPPNADLSILHGKLQVLEPVAPRGQRMPIDYFFQHLAADQKERAVAILLSGMGSDGTSGVKAINENFGMVMVQDPVSAKYDSMPRSAINTGLADYIAAAHELPAMLMQYVTHGRAAPRDRIPAEGGGGAMLEKVFVLLRAHTGNDFSCYKKSTIFRRLERRMSVHQLDRLPRYVRFLQENPQEVELLYKELLIGVTSFFRDPALFDFLKDKAISQLLQARPISTPVRVWNPACSTGEETYSLAIALKETLEHIGVGNAPAIQIFATDIDNDAINKARRGRFSAGIAADVSSERLTRFFVYEDEGYRVRKEVRDLVVFATQNLLVNPPFTNIDILCCRNLLIYLNPDTQQRLLPLMHFALRPGGLLILSPSESIGHFGHLFGSLDKKWKVFRRKEVVERLRVEIPVSARPRERTGVATPEKPGAVDMDMTYVIQRMLLDCYGPPAVAVNSAGDILYVNGRTGKYLEPASGKVNNNVFAMAREGLRDELGAALRNAAAHKTTITVSDIRVKVNGDVAAINLSVRPLIEPDARRDMFLVVFEEIAAGPAAPSAQESSARLNTAAPATELEDELRRTHERLQATVEEMETTQEELRAANEELQSNNEELQSANEELNSSKEELQSLNEELQTVNAELQSKIEELSQSNSDMKNLLNGTEIATIFLDNNLGVKRFTPQAAQIVNLTASDVGRPLGHFTTKLNYDRLIEDAREVLDTLVPRDVQVQTTDDGWYHLRVLPYRTADNVIAGIVMTFADVTRTKHLEQLLINERTECQSARDYAQSIIATIRAPLVVLDGELRIVSASAAFYETFQVLPGDTAGQLIYEIGDGQWNIAGLRQLLEEVLPKHTQIEDFRVEHTFPMVGHKVLLLSARQVASGAEAARLILLTMEDITALPGPTRTEVQS